MIRYFSDPRGILTPKIYSIDLSKSLLENLLIHFPDGLDANIHRFVLNGNEIDTLAYSLDFKPSTFDAVDIIRRQQGTLDAWAIGAFIASLAVSVASVLLTPRPVIPNNIGTSKDSPNNKLTSQTNMARLYQAKPDIYGSRRVFPDLVSSAVYEYIRHEKYVTELMCIGMGYYDIEKVRYADNLLDDIDGSKYKIYSPGDIIPQIIEAYESPEVNGQELLALGDTSEDASRGDEEQVWKLWDFVEGRIRTTSRSFEWMQAEIDKNDKVDCRMTTYTTYDMEVEVHGEWQIKRFTDKAIYNVEFDRYEITDQLTYYYIKSMSLIDSGRSLSHVYWFRIEIINTTLRSSGVFILPHAGEQIWFNVIFNRGLKAAVQIQATWYEIDGDDNQIEGTEQSRIFYYSADTYNPRYYTNKIEVLRGRYAVKFMRLTGATGSDNPSQTKLEWLAAVDVRRDVVAKDTLIEVVQKATEQAVSLKERKINVQATRKTITYDTNSKEIDYELRPSRSFADAVLHSWIVMAGKSITRLNVDELYQIANSLSDEQLGYFDFSFDDKDISLGQRIQTICNAARVAVSKDGLQYRFIRNEKRLAPSYQFDGRNLANDETGGSIQYRFQEPSSFDGIELEWVDARNANPNGTDKKAYIKLFINTATKTIESGEPKRPKKIELAGCTNHMQAMNRAQLEARALLYSRVNVDDVSLNDAAYLPIGSWVRWVDIYDSGVISGEILAIKGNEFFTNEEIHLDSNTQYRVSITDEYGQPSEWLDVKQGSDKKSFIADFDKAFTANYRDIQCGSRFIISTEKEEKLDFMLMEKQPSDKDRIQINLSFYDERVYEYDEVVNE